MIFDNYIWNNKNDPPNLWLINEINKSLGLINIQLKYLGFIQYYS